MNTREREKNRVDAGGSAPVKTFGGAMSGTPSRLPMPTLPDVAVARHTTGQSVQAPRLTCAFEGAGP